MCAQTNFDSITVFCREREAPSVSMNTPLDSLSHWCTWFTMYNVYILVYMVYNVQRVHTNVIKIF